MNGLEFYIENQPLNTSELEKIYGLIDFYFKEDNLEDLTIIKENFESVKTKFNATFRHLLEKKINLLERELELKTRTEDLRLIYILLLNDFKDYNEYYKLVGLNVEKLKKIVDSISSTYLSHDECQKIDEKLETLREQEQNFRINHFKKYDDFLWMFLNSRYHTAVIKQITNVVPSEFTKILDKEKLREYYPENIDEIINNKSSLLYRLRSSRVGNFYTISEVELLEIVKDDVLKLSESDYKKVKLVAEFLKKYGNIEKIIKKDDLTNYNKVFYLLSDSNLQNILKEEIYIKLRRHLEFEDYLRNLFVIEKVELVKQMLIKYYTCNGNIIKLIESLEEEEKVLRLLSDDDVKRLIGINEFEKVSKSLKDYKNKECVIKIIKKIKTPEIINK